MAAGCLCPTPRTSNVKFHFATSARGKRVFFDAAASAAADSDDDDDDEAEAGRVGGGGGDQLSLAESAVAARLRQRAPSGATVVRCHNFLVVRPSPPPPPSRPLAQAARGRRRRAGRAKAAKGEEEEEEKTTRQAPRRRWVYTIFPDRGYVNVSGVGDFGEIGPALDWFNSVFKTSVSMRRAKVDNSTSSGRLACAHAAHASGRLNLPRFKNYIEHNCAEAREKRLRFSLRPFYFPGGVLQCGRRGAPDRKGSAILFANAKYVLVGPKSPEEIGELHRLVCALTTKYTSAATQATPSAGTAAR
jgi:hypothetical protein